MELEAAKVLAAGVCMGLGAIGPGIGEGVAASKGLEAMGRHPAVANKIFTNMLVSMAICESTAIYSLVLALIILFVL